MDDLQSTENLTKNTPTAETIGSFIQNRHISLREISKGSGITAANLSKCFTGKTMLTLPYFVRIVAASGSDDLYDWVFDIPINRYLVQRTKTPDTFSGTDYIFLLILLKDYYINQNDHCAKDILNAIFNTMSQHLFYVPFENVCCIDSVKADTSYLDRFCNMFYDNRNLIGYSYPEIMIDDHHLGILMHAGGSVIWKDVRNLITWYLTDNNMRINSMKNRSILSRIRSTSEQAYKIDELLDADDEMRMNGIFFSVCCLAAKNIIMLNKICTDDSTADMNLLAKMQYGISSFFACLRILEQDDRQSQNLQNFWAFFRQTAADSPYHMAQLRNLSETMPEYFPCRALRFYES